MENNNLLAILQQELDFITDYAILEEQFKNFQREKDLEDVKNILIDAELQKQIW